MKRILYPCFLVALSLLSGCGSYTAPSSDMLMGGVATAASGAGGFMIGKAIDDSDEAKLAGTAVGLIAAQQLYEMTKKGDQQKIAEAYEQGKREARTEASNSYWRSVTGADGSEFYAAQQDGKNKHLRQIQYDPHVNQGVIYGGSYAPSEMVIRGQ